MHASLPFSRRKSSAHSGEESRERTHIGISERFGDLDGAPHIEQLRAYDRTVAAWAAGEAVEVTYCAHWEGVSAALSTAVDNTISCTALM